MIHLHPYPWPKNNGFLSRERILGVSGKGGGYMDSGFVFWRPPGKSPEIRRNTGIAKGLALSKSLGRLI
jgi:hypothetical protein